MKINDERNNQYTSVSLGGLTNTMWQEEIREIKIGRKETKFPLYFKYMPAYKENLIEFKDKY